MSQYLSEAFKRLDALNEETFSITDNGLEDYVEFQDNDELDTTIDVIDMEAETEEDLEDSYVGKVILDCCVCHSKLYKDVEDVVIDGELTNTNEECPFCYTTDGFKVIGQVATFGEDSEDEDTKETEETKETDQTDTLDESVKINGENLSYAVINPDGTYAGVPCTTEEEARELAAQKKGRVVVEFKSLGKMNEDKTSNRPLRRNPNKVTNEGIFDSKQKKQQAYNKEIKEVCGKDATPFAYDIVKQATGLLQDVANAICDESNSTALAQSLYDTIKNAKAGIKKYPESLLRSIINMGRKYCYESSYHLDDLADNMKLMSKLQSNSKIGSKAREYLMDNINTKLVDSLNHTLSSLKREHNLRESKSIEESVNNVNVETDDGIVNVSSDENGRVTVTTEPNTSSVSDAEVITPLEPEVQSEISDNVGDGEEIEIDMDEFDEESFDELGEGYLKKVYENVNSFKTSNVSFIKDKLILEGVIKFNSGSSKKTNFIFGIREATKSGKVRFIGENKEIARGRKSFTVTGRVENKKFLSESLNYNYGVKDSRGKAQRLYGTVKTNKRG